MRLRSITFTLSAILALSLMAGTAQLSTAAAPKPGSKCSKLGAKELVGGMTFTCVKSGKKQVWSKGVPSPKSQSNSQSSAGATIGAACFSKDAKASIPNGTAICVSENGKLTWQRWMPEGEKNQGGSNTQNAGNQSNSGLVEVGSKCSKKGDTGSIRNGTAYCLSSNGELKWIWPASQPVPSDGVWLYEPQGTAGWNTDLPPYAWTGEPKWFQPSWDIPTSLPIGKKCTSNEILTNYITDLDPLQSITPQGFMQPGSHALPVPHMYYNTGSTTEKDPNGVAYRSKILNMYAPADMTLYAASKLTYTTSDGYQYDEYMMTWHFCGTYWMFNAHVGWIAPEIQRAIDSAPVKKCQQGGQLNSKSQDCYSERFAYSVKAGTLYAKSSGRAHGFDFGFTDASKTISTRINPSAFAPRWAAGLCHIDFYPQSLRGPLERKLVGDNGCGQLVSDLPGTAQGVWLSPVPDRYSVQEDYHIALAKHWSDKSLLVFSIGWNAEIPGLDGGVFAFTPKSAGPNNKSFAQVKSGEVMCYDNLQGMTKSGGSAPTLYVSMREGDTEKLTIAKGSGACGSGPYVMPANSATFERKVKN